MSDALERLVNLAMYLASSPGLVTAEDVRAHVMGYPPGQDQAAFLRMFERDKDDLRDAGLSITSDSEGTYRLDARATFASEVHLSAVESAAIRVVGTAFVDDPSFPFATELHIALAKLATALEDQSVVAVGRLAEEQPAQQGAAVAALDRAISARKRVGFDYVNAAGEHKHHDVEPYGLFTSDGRWYLVGRDRERDELRVYAVVRLGALCVNSARPKTPDFGRPSDFDVRRFIALPFQYGTGSFEARLRFEPEHAWRASALTSGAGVIEQSGDGSLVWIVSAEDEERLMRWVVANGPGIDLLAPPELGAELAERLERVAALHG